MHALHMDRMHDSLVSEALCMQILVEEEGAARAVRAVHMVHQGTCVWPHP